MQIHKEDKISDIVTKNFQTAKVFENLGIDYCCGGKKSINEACQTKGIDPNIVLEEISKVHELNQTSSHFDKWDVDFLVDYIVNNHHSYILTAIPSIEHRLQKVIMAHGEKNHHLLQIDVIFSAVKDDLLGHMAKEEKMLFPYIKKLSF